MRNTKCVCARECILRKLYGDKANCLCVGGDSEPLEEPLPYMQVKHDEEPATEYLTLSKSSQQNIRPIIRV